MIGIDDIGEVMQTAYPASTNTNLMQCSVFGIISLDKFGSCYSCNNKVLYSYIKSPWTLHMLWYYPDLGVNVSTASLQYYIYNMTTV